MNRTRKKELTEAAAKANVRRFFANAQGRESLPVEEIFSAVDRLSYPEKKNRAWLSNKLSELKPHQLLTTVQDKTTGKTAKIALTQKGKEVLGISGKQTEQPSLLPPEGRYKVTFGTVKADVEILREEFPELEIVFDVRLKTKENFTSSN